MLATVDDEMFDDAYVVDENANVWRADHEFALPRLSEIVAFEPPSWNPSAPVTESDEFVASVDVDVVLRSPLDPVYATPCPSDGRKSEDENVDDAVEKRPFPNPIVVDVEL